MNGEGGISFIGRVMFWAPIKDIPPPLHSTWFLRSSFTKIVILFPFCEHLDHSVRRDGPPLDSLEGEAVKRGGNGEFPVFGKNTA